MFLLVQREFTKDKKYILETSVGIYGFTYATYGACGHL